MDPLVGAAMWLQRALAFSNGTLLALSAAGLLVWQGPSAHPWLMGAWVLLAGSFGYRLRQRLGRARGASLRRLDVELGLHAGVLSYVVVELTPGGLLGPYQPLVYAVLCVTAVVGSPSAVAATGGTMAALELGIGLFGNGIPRSVMIVHLAVLPVFGGMNWIVFRGEIARVRRVSQDRVNSELLRLREVARSYRLGDAVRGPSDHNEWESSSDPVDERLLQSSVEQLHVSLRFVLTLVRTTLGLRTAALLWRSEAQLFVREVSSDVRDLCTGPFELERGIVAAALTTERSVWISAAKSRGRMPLYPADAPTGDLAVIPIIDNGTPLGALLLEASEGHSLDESAQGLLDETARFAHRAIENERLFLTVQRSKEEQGKLYRAANLLSKARSEVEVIQAGVDAARGFARFDFAAVTLYHRKEDVHEICAVSGEGTEALVGQRFASNQGLVSMVVANRHPLPFRGEYHRHRQTVFSSQLALPLMPSLIILPLYMHDTPLGTLILGSQNPGTFGDDVRPLLEVLARHVSVSLANARMLKRLEDLATTDGMTGLLNKRALTEVARHKIRSSQRFSKPLSVIIGDIDHFKKVNDTYGHDIGDVVIKGFGAILERSKRETDAVGRFGGEEFVLVCEETDATGARLLAERIRQELEATQFHTPQGPLSVTCSLGIATCPRAGQEWEALFKATDEALYASKRNGRNRVSVWSASMGEAAA